MSRQIHRLSVLHALVTCGKKRKIHDGFARRFFRGIVAGGNRVVDFFFPCSGNGNGTSWNNRGSNGNYWSASLNSATNGRNLNFNSGGGNPQNNNNRFNGFAVRPVQHFPAWLSVLNRG